VTAVDTPASCVKRPGPPHVEHVTVEAGQRPASAPQGEECALDPTLAEICVVMVSVHGRAGAVVSQIACAMVVSSSILR
jgi:hypothetical protein